jgi:quinol monooxygenase YgiN
MMFGSVFHLRPKPGHEQQLLEEFKRWDTERRPKVQGSATTLVFRTVNGSGELIGIAVFESREAYERNAQDPEQDRWYQELRSHLEADPVWEDGDVLYRSQ